MSDTLILTAGPLTLDLLSAPYCLGAGYGFGDAASDTSIIESLLLDGDRVLGDRFGNREHVLPIHVKVPEGAGDRIALSQASSRLVESVMRYPTFTLTWAPDGGLPLEWDCYRGKAAVGWSQLEEGFRAQTVTLTFPARPFGRTPGVEVAAVLSARASTARAVLYDVDPILGSARTPVSAVLASTAQAGSFLVHIPPDDADPAAPILTAMPDDSNLVGLGDCQLLRGTYAILLGIKTFNGTDPKTMTTIVTQDGLTASKTVLAPYTPGDGGSGRLIYAGTVTLPLALRPAGAPTSLTFSFGDDDGVLVGTAIVNTLMLCDVRGSTVAVNRAPQGSTTGRRVYVDAPTPEQALGTVYMSATIDRDDAYAAPLPRLGGGPLSLTPGDDRTALVFADTGTPSLDLSYAPRWLAERYA